MRNCPCHLRGRQTQMISHCPNHCGHSLVGLVWLVLTGLADKRGSGGGGGGCDGDGGGVLFSVGLVITQEVLAV